MNCENISLHYFTYIIQYVLLKGFLKNPCRSCMFKYNIYSGSGDDRGWAVRSAYTFSFFFQNRYLKSDVYQQSYILENQTLCFEREYREL